MDPVQWLTAIIPATGEAEVGKITVISQPLAKSQQDPILNNKLVMVI
jgi:hypothetical protein